ncbi:MAG TPA: hypothetical protein VFE62_21560 [Gemmataceae bacterium]|nr:hypothetical protein [Gemmataceae bacterium]
MPPLARPRNGIALLAGIAAALIVWTLPPLPDWRVTTTPHSVLQALSPGGRHVITCHHDKNEVQIQAWNRDDPGREILGLNRDRWSIARFSPDGATLVVIAPEREVKEYNLASGNFTNSWRLDYASDVFYSPGGELHYVNGHSVRHLIGQSVRRLANHQEVHRLPESIDRFRIIRISRHCHPFAVYAKYDATSCEFLIYDPFRSEEVARMELPENTVFLDLSRNGHVLLGGLDPFQWRRDRYVVVDGAGFSRTFGSETSLSPNGDFVVTKHPRERPEWLQKWWPLDEDDTTLDIMDWRTGVTHASFRSNSALAFSPDNGHVAMMRRDGVVEIYAWPLPTPWGLLAAASLGAAATVWSIGWLWACWRRTETPHTTLT